MDDNNRFDRKAADWDKNESRKRLAAAVSEALLALPLQPSWQAMEFGCGTGLVSLPVAARVKNLVALDSSAGMIGVLEQKIADLKITNIETICSEIDNVEMVAGFDLIFTSMTLHHVEDISATIHKFSRLLKVGGRLAIADLDAEDGSFHKPGSGERHHGFGRKDIERKLLEHGFGEITFDTVHTITRQTSAGTVKDFTVFFGTAVKQ